MNSFTVLVPTLLGKTEFRFQKIMTVHAVKYQVTATDKEGKTCSFVMEAKEGYWSIVNAPKPTDWILEVEDELAAAIQRNKE
jgi:hypothetical protein